MLIFFAVERDPSKRRVKPVDPHLLQLEFAGVGSSSDDSDFKMVTDDDSGFYDIFILLDCHFLVAVKNNQCTLFLILEVFQNLTA